ncbi:MAG: hypothetical protein P8Y24_12455 [Gammaproteobacteria bacterium]|jgi:hypothetical protein
MTEENFQDESKRAPSVTRNDAQGDRGFSVKASPFNPVKVELGFILLIALLLIFSVHRVSENSAMQLAILSVYGLCGMGWLVFRIRQVEHRLKNKETD